MTCSPAPYVSPIYIFCLQSLTFILLLVLISHFVKKRLLPFIYKTLESQERDTQQLEQEKELLAEQQHLIDAAIAEQQRLFEQLQQSLVHWKTVLQKKREQAEEQRITLEQEMEVHQQARNARLAAQYLQQQTVPQACKQAEYLLQEKFSSEKKGQLFLSALCAKIEREYL